MSRFARLVRLSALLLLAVVLLAPLGFARDEPTVFAGFVPSGLYVLRMDGKEVGRIVGNAWIVPEKALLEHLP